MRIAYFLTWHEGVGRGVLDKVNDQVRSWILAGHEVGVFLVSDEDSRDDPDNLIPNSRTQGFRNSLGSLVAQIRALKDLKRFAPEIVYLRPSMRNLWLIRLFPSVPMIAEIQTNDLLESKLKSRLRFVLTWVSRKSLRRASGMVFVSHELAGAPEFESFSPRRTTIGNGIDLSRVTMADRRKSNGPPSLLFLGSSSVPWQGIDHLLSFAQENLGWDFHIVGDRSKVAKASPNVFFHGTKDAESIREIAENVDLGVGTLGLYRKGMQEASPLKVRYYLALGLPVVGAYRDTDIDPSCDYFLQIPNQPNALLQSSDSIEAFAYQWRGQKVSPSVLHSIDSSTKEAERLEFFSRVFAEWQIASPSVR